MSLSEPPPPQRGLTAAERGSDATEAEKAAADPALSTGQRLRAALSFRFWLGQADGYPAGVKQFLQFCLVLTWPAWLFAVLVGSVLYGIVWALFWPLRAWMKRNRPEDYAASQKK